MKDLIKGLFRRRKNLVPDTSQLIVLRIQDNAITISESLGISKARALLLSNLVVSKMEAYPKTTDALHHMSKECVHANEVAYCSFILGRFYSERENTPGVIARRIKF